MDRDAVTITMDGAASVGLDEELAILGRIARFQIRGVIGSGGEGVVLAAHDQELGRPVAIKVLLRDADVAHARTMREAQALAQLSHPNVVTVYEVLRVGKRTGIVMALIDGCDLVQWRKPGHTWRDIVGVYLQAARGLAAAHRAGLVHRDFKPSNALIDADGVVRVSDFGLAHRAGQQLGAVGGTPAYMAPEQSYGDAVDARADQYSFAVALYEALAGYRPEKSPSPPPGPRWLRKVVLRALAIDPAARFPSMTEVVARLERGLARRQWATGVAGAAAIVASVGVWFAVAPHDTATREDPPPRQWQPVTIATESGNSAIIDIAISRDGTTLARLSATDISIEPRVGGRASHVKIPAELGKLNSIKLSDAGDSVIAAFEGVPGGLDIAALWEFEVAGGKPRRLVPPTSKPELHIGPDWDVAPDGSVVAVALEEAGKRLLWIERTGVVRQLAEGEGENAFAHPAVSFDGAQIAVQRTLSGRTRIEVIESATGKASVVARGVFCATLDWLGPRSLAYIDVEGSYSRVNDLVLYMLPERQVSWIPYKSAPFTRIFPFRSTRQGVLLQESSLQARLNIIDLAGAGRRAQVASGSLSDAMPAGWLPSGTLIFGANMRGRLQIQAMRSDGTIDLVHSATQAQAPLAVLGDSIVFGRFPGADDMIPRLDIIVGRYYGKTGELFRLDANGNVTALGATKSFLAIRCAGDRATPCILIEDDFAHGSAVSWNPATGARGVTVARWDNASQLFHALAPDGRTLAYVAVANTSREIELLDVEAKKPPRRIPLPGYLPRFFTWHPDGGLIVTAQEPTTGRWEILKVTSLSTSPIVSQLMVIEGVWIVGEPRINADGTRLAIPINDQSTSYRWVDL